MRRSAPPERHAGEGRARERSAVRQGRVSGRDHNRAERSAGPAVRQQPEHGRSELARFPAVAGGQRFQHLRPERHSAERREIVVPGLGFG